MATSYNMNTHVLPKIPAKFWNHAYEEHPTLMKFIEKDEKQNGGLSYDPNRISAKDNTSTFYAGTTHAAVIENASQTNKLLKATYGWVNMATPITLTYDEYLKAGESDLVKITALEAKKYQATQEHMDALAETFMKGDGSSNTAIGLEVLVNPAATFGGVVPGTDTDWVSNAVTTAVVLTGASQIQNAYRACQRDGKSPDLGPTTDALFTRICSVLGMDIQRQAKDDGSYKFGFANSQKWNKLNIYPDRDVTSGKFLMLNSETIHLFKHTKEFMKVRLPADVTDGNNIWKSKIGDINSSFILAADSRWVHGGLLSVS